MALIIYESTKESFLNSVTNDSITDDIYQIYQKKAWKITESSNQIMDQFHGIYV